MPVWLVGELTSMSDSAVFPGSQRFTPRLANGINITNIFILQGTVNEGIWLGWWRVMIVDNDRRVGEEDLVPI